MFSSSLAKLNSNQAGPFILNNINYKVNLLWFAIPLVPFHCLLWFLKPLEINISVFYLAIT